MGGTAGDAKDGEESHEDDAGSELWFPVVAFRLPVQWEARAQRSQALT